MQTNAPMARPAVRLTVRPIFTQLASPLLLPESFDPASRGAALSLGEGELVALCGSDGRFVATAYIGRQNKGIGWVLSTNPKEAVDEAFFARRLRLALAKRITILKNPKTNAFRVFNGEGDGIGGLTIDYYDESYLVTYYSAGIRRFHAWILRALRSMTDPRTVVVKCRFDGEPPDGQLVHGEESMLPREIVENGVRLTVDLIDGAMTGIFLDQRDVRRALRNRYSRGKRVLNLFSYSGAFSVFAALGGAVSTRSVDAAARSVALTQANFAANSLAFGEGTPHTVHICDVFQFLRTDRGGYDVIVLDPPSFSTSGGKTFRSEKDYPALVSGARKLLRRNGVMILSTNNARISPAAFDKKIAEGLGGAPRVLERFSLPRDFRTNPKYTEGDYLKVVFVQPDA